MKKVISIILIVLLSGCSSLAIKTKDNVPTAAAKTGARMVMFPLTLGLSEAAIKQSEASKLMGEGKAKEAKEKHQAAKNYMKKWGLGIGTLAVLGAIAGAVANNAGSTRRRTYVIRDDDPLTIYSTTTIGNSTYYHTNKGIYRVYSIGNTIYVDPPD